MKGIYLVTDSTLCMGRSLVDVVQAAISVRASYPSCITDACDTVPFAAGCRAVCAVQLREKDISSRQFVELARAVVGVMQGSGVPLIINDRADIAQIVGAQGLHIGQSDIDYADARRLLGPQAIIGLSIESPEQLIQCSAMPGLDYVAASPVFSTHTKQDTAPALGLAGLAAMRAATTLPIVAIGGINSSNIAQVVAAGANSVAVVSAICSAPDPAAAVRALSLCF